jgi:invasion protein IalB
MQPAVVPSGEAVPPDVAAGQSSEQRAAEVHLLAALAEVVGRPLVPTTIQLPSGVRVEVDGADSHRTILVECWAHVGRVKGAQRLEVLTDAFNSPEIANNIPAVPVSSSA